MQRRTILAVLLCLVIFFVWYDMVMPRLYPPLPPKKGGGKGEPVKTEVQKTPPSPERTVALPGPPRHGPVDRKEDVKETKYVRARFTNRGASVESLEIRFPTEEAYVSLLPASGDGHFRIRMMEGGDRTDTENWKQVDVQEPNAVEYRYDLANFTTLSKRFVLDPEGYGFRMSLAIKNESSEERRIKFEWIAIDGMEHDGDYRPDQYLFGAIGRKTTEVAAQLHGILEVVKNPVYHKEAERTWFGAKNRYFACVVLPRGERERALFEGVKIASLAAEKVKKMRGHGNIEVSAWTLPLTVGSQPHVYEYSVYTGPVERSRLSHLGQGVELLVSYGNVCIFGPVVHLVVPILLWILNFFAGLIHNYGVAILLTTLSIRMCLFPLSIKSQVSMYRMQQLQPKFQLLRERYKDDQQKMFQEQRKLFKEHKVNPMGGCLPMVLQIPVWIGMFSMIDTVIELRQAPFLLWIQDLSQPDRLFKLPFSVLGATDFNLLPLVMTVTWFLQALTAPKSPDPQMQAQQKMFLFMPILFGFLCYGYASGLSLYFFINSLLGILEQKAIKKYFLKPAVAK